MKSNLELALIACSYRPVTVDKKTTYMKLYGFTWIIVDMENKEFAAFFSANNDFTCWNKRQFSEVFDEDISTVQEYAAAIQNYEAYDGPHGHGCHPQHMDCYMLIDDYFKQFQFL